MERFYAGGRRQTYYELFKACRLCGSGGGYKMPIVQGAAPPGAEPELRHKIRDCCSIDVQPDDKMPPLICELCVDKVNDFYEFREMCHATNTRVRSSLGLPPQTLSQDLADDCILGVSGPLIYNSKELELSQSVNMKIKNKDKKNIKKIIPPPSPPPAISLREKRGRKTKIKPEALSLLAERLNSGTKRRRGNEPIVIDIAPPIKKLRFSEIPPPKKINTPPTRSEKRSIPPPSIIKKPKEPIIKKPSFSHPCSICKIGFNKMSHLKQHALAHHKPNIISEKLGCSPCKEWFTSARLAEEHHKWHKTSSTFYRCDRCSAEFKVLQSYAKHFALRQCIPETTVPDPKCSTCLKTFVTENIMSQHKCIDPAAIGGECPKCKNNFPRRAQLKRHQTKCKGVIEVNPNNPLLKTLKPIKITMSKCDNLLQRIKREPIENDDQHSVIIYDVSSISLSRPMSIKTEPIEDGYNESSPFDVEIKHEIKEEYPDYAIEDNGLDDNYDSDSSQSEAEVAAAAHGPNIVINPFARKNNTQVESLSFISLRTIFSDKAFKRKSRQKRKVVKIESQKSISRSAFNSMTEKSDENNVHEKNTSDPFENLNCSVSNLESVDENLIGEINTDNTDRSDNIATVKDLKPVNKIEYKSMETALSYNNAAPSVNNLEETSVSDSLLESEDLFGSTSCENEFPMDNTINTNEQLCHIDKVVSESPNVSSLSTSEDISRLENINTEEEMDCDNLNNSIANVELNTADKIIENINTDFDVDKQKEDDSVCTTTELADNVNDSINKMDVDSVSSSNVVTSDENKDSPIIISNKITDTFNENTDDEKMSIDDDLSNELISNDVIKISDTNNSYDSIDAKCDSTITNEKSDIEQSAMDNEILSSELINDSKIDDELKISVIKDQIKSSENIFEEDENNSEKNQTNNIECNSEKEVIDDISLKQSEIETKTPDKFSNAPSENTDLDSYIDSVLQGDSSPLAEKEKIEVSNKNDNMINNTDIQSTASNEPVFDKEIEDGSDNTESAVTDTFMDDVLQKGLDDFEIKENSIKSDKITIDTTFSANDIEDAALLNAQITSQDEEKLANSEPVKSVNCEVKNVDELLLNTIDSNFKPDPEPVEKSDAEILDLVSDSGDDCNIIDLPDKIKAFEDQLLADDVDDNKDCQPMDAATVEALLKDDDPNEADKFGAEDVSSDSLNSIDNAISLNDNSLNTNNEIINPETEKVSSLEEISKSLDLDAISDNDFDLNE